MQDLLVDREQRAAPWARVVLKWSSVAFVSFPSLTYRLLCVSTLRDCKWRSNTNDQSVQMCFECDCVLGLIGRYDRKLQKCDISCVTRRLRFAIVGHFITCVANNVPWLYCRNYPTGKYVQTDFECFRWCRGTAIQHIVKKCLDYVYSTCYGDLLFQIVKLQNRSGWKPRYY